MGTDEKAIRILLADPHSVFRSGLRLFLEEYPEFVVLGEAGDSRETLLSLRKLTPDILIINIGIARTSGMEILLEAAGEARTILLAPSMEPAQASEALELGVRGILLLNVDPEVLLSCIHAVMKGHQWVGRRRIGDLSPPLPVLQDYAAGKKPVNNFGLTRREMEILAKVASGKKNSNIAQQLRISEKTVKRHIANIYDKVGVYNRLELMLFALLHGLLD